MRRKYRRKAIERLEPRYVLNGAPIGSVDPMSLNRWYLNGDNDTTSDMDLDYGFSNDKLVSGNFNPSIRNKDFPGVVRPYGTGHLQWLLDSDGDTDDEYRFRFGLATDIALMADLTGDGIDDAIVVRPNGTSLNWYVADGSNFPARTSNPDGPLLDVWNANGTPIVYGASNDKPVAGNWDGVGGDDLGVVSAVPSANGLSQWFLNTNQGLKSFEYGLPSDVHVVGDWDHNGTDNVGVVRDSGSDNLLHWLLDTDSNTDLQSRDPSEELNYSFGLDHHVPVVGEWFFPEVMVTANNTEIYDGQSQAVNFGTVCHLGAESAIAFYVKNTGSSPLHTSSLTFPSGFRLTDPLSSAIPAGQTDTFALRLKTDSLGAKAGVVTFNTNDGNELIFNFPVSGLVNDCSAPSASLSAPDILSGGGTSYDFTVTYSDNQAVNASTVDGNDIIVTGPNGFSQSANLVQLNPGSNAATIAATYRIHVPVWDFGFYGTYAVRLQSNQISDVVGNVTPGGSLGTFAVNISRPQQDQPVSQLGAVDLLALNRWYLSLDNDTTADIDIDYGFGTDQIVTGNFNATKPEADFPGIARRHNESGGLEWYLDEDGDTDHEYRFFFGLQDDIAIVADFNGDGTDDVAAVRPNTVPDPVVGIPSLVWYVAHGPFPARNGENPGPTLDIDQQFEFGFDGDQPKAGDWDGDGRDSPGIISQTAVNGLSRWFIAAPNGVATLDFGFPSDTHIVGDWDGDGIDNVGVVRDVPQDNILRWLLDTDSNFAGRDDSEEISYAFGLDQHAPVVGVWQLPESTVLDSGQAIGTGTTLTLGQGGPGEFPLSKQYEIVNSGTAPLEIFNVFVPTGFEVAGIPTTVSPQSSQNFTVSTDNSISLYQSGTLHFSTNDGSLQDRFFEIELTEAAPEIDINIPRNSELNVGFGQLDAVDQITTTVAITNHGNAILQLSAPNITGPFEAIDFPSSVGIGETEEFEIRVTATSTGEFQGNISIPNSDADENPYAFGLYARVYLEALAFSLDQPQVLPGGISVTDADLVQYFLDQDGPKFEIRFKGEALQLTPDVEDMNAFYSESGCNIAPAVVFSTSNGGTVDEVGSFDAADLIRHWMDTDGSLRWSLFFDGSAHGLANQNIDAAAKVSAEWLLLSIDGDAELQGASGQIIYADDSDVLAFHLPTGLWAMYLDGSEAQLASQSQGIDALSAYDDTSSEYNLLSISTYGQVSLPGTSLDGNAVARRVSANIWSTIFDGSVFGISANIDAIDGRVLAEITEKRLGCGSIIADEDTGDAPLPYPRAIHEIIEGEPHLGGQPQSELQPPVGGDPNAAGDSDDDGVTFRSLSGTASSTITPGGHIEIELDVQGAAGFVDAWIDFNRNNRWDPEERILPLPSMTEAFSTDLHTVTIDVPESALAGVTYARFRISSTGGLTPGDDGTIAGGEVEDYLLNIKQEIAFSMDTFQVASIEIRASNGLLEIVNSSTSETLASGPLEFVKSLTIDGDPTQANEVIFNFASGGYFELEDGIQVTGAAGQGDRLIIVADGSAQAEYSTSMSPAGKTLLTVDGNDKSSILDFAEFEEIVIEGMESFRSASAWNIGSSSIHVDAINAVELSSLTQLSGGSFSSTSGIFLDNSGSVTGFGTLEVPNDSTKPLTNNGSIQGQSNSQPITLRGFIQGLGSLGHAAISGTLSPGLSPAVVEYSNVDYLTTSNTIIEIGGLAPGEEYDQINHLADVSIQGQLTVEWINDFTPIYGNVFEIMTWVGNRQGVFQEFVGQLLNTNVAVIPDFAANSLSLVTTGPGDANLDGKVSFADFLILQNSFGQVGSWSSGDFNLDGRVTFADFLILQNAFGQVYFS